MIGFSSQQRASVEDGPRSAGDSRPIHRCRGAHEALRALSPRPPPPTWTGAGPRSTRRRPRARLDRASPRTTATWAL